jgi:hypothetical protein
MKTINSRLLLLAAALAGLAAARLAAAPLAQPANVRTKPDVVAPVITVLPAGTEPFMAVGVSAPAGWLAVALPGPHEVFVRSNDLLKDLSPRPGANYYLLDRGAEALVGTVEKGDTTEMLETQGRHTRFRLGKALIGYIPAPAVASAPVAVTTPPQQAPRDLTAPPAPAISAGQVADPARKPALAPPRGPTAELPRLFEGTLASTRSALRPRRPYDYELRDTNGVRYAYLDLARLPPTEQADRYVGAVVVIYGTAKSAPGVADMVIVAENLRAR